MADNEKKPRSASETKLAFFQDGPIAEDLNGKHLWTEGETEYLHSVAGRFKSLDLVTYVAKGDHPLAKSLGQSFLGAPNMVIRVLPWSSGWGAIGKLWQMARVAMHIWKLSAAWEAAYLFIPSYPSLIAFIILKLRNKSYFIYGASDWEELSPDSLLRGKLWQRFFRLFNARAEKLIVGGAAFCLTAGRSTLNRFSAWSGRVCETVPRLSWTSFSTFERADTCAGERIRLLQVSHLNTRKGVTYLLKALKILNGNTPGRFILTLAGTGDILPDLEMEAADLGQSGNVEFLGHIPNDDRLYSLYRASDIYVLSSLSEGFPRVLYEAAANCLPIVATDVGGISRYLPHEDRALLTPAADPAGLAEAIERMAVDGNLRQRLIKSAYTFVTDFLKEKDGGAQISKLFDDLLYQK